MRLKGKTAFISGAGRNMGKAMALTFAREGADLILLAKENGDRLNQVARECEGLGVKALPLLADVSKHEEVNRVVQLGLERFGKVDVLVNVVGIRPHLLPWEISCEQWHQAFAVNLHSSFYLTKALVPGMIERKKGGSIIIVGGMGVLTALNPKGAATTASKSGAYGLVKVLAKALGPHGIRANLLVPGIIDSERTGAGTPQTDANLAKITMGRFGKTQEMANVALFLASDESSYITGDRINCSGGLFI
jgi:3-oxoacyl-[acyl-carrier protein] reductase